MCLCVWVCVFSAYSPNVSHNSSYETDSTEVGSLAARYDSHIPRFPLTTLVSICVVLGAMIVATVLGNVFVITAIVVERSLQGVSNYLILSLAVTDLLVAVLVMPLSLLNEVGAEACWDRETDQPVGLTQRSRERTGIRLGDSPKS